jgi:xanthine dehydrogenase YagR molybdenum-binding subunit
MLAFGDEPDDIVNSLAIKGLGEIGIASVAAAIANAIYHAIGKRVRDLPVEARSSRFSCAKRAPGG